MAKTEIIMAFHADMVAAPNLDEEILRHLQKGTVVCATRAEPPIHPDGPEKVLIDLGSEVDDFDYSKFISWLENDYRPKHKKLKNQGIFAPWCIYKEDFLAIGGHDNLFAPQSREDSDLFNRFLLKGYKLVQTWEALVYHFTSRGSRFNKYSGGDTGVDSPEWQYTNSKNERNFARKWGSEVSHTPLLKPIVFPKYNISFGAKNCTRELLEILEPWCDEIYCDTPLKDVEDYIEKEEVKTTYNLKKRIKPLSLFERSSDITVDIDCNNFKADDYHCITKLSQMLRKHNSIGAFKISNLILKINNLDEYQNNLIISK
jgi:hypothetical protein